MRRAIIFIASLFLVNACAAYPPAKTEKGVYTNPKYQFSIHVPEGWEQVDKIPPALSGSHFFSTYQMLNTVFVGPNKDGYIVIMCDKSIFGTKGLTDHKVRKYLTKHFSRQRQIQINTRGVKWYRWKLHNTAILRRPVLTATVGIGIERPDEAPVETRGNMYLFTCHQDDTCTVLLGLISETETFNNNLPVFESVAGSINKYH